MKYTFIPLAFALAAFLGASSLQAQQPERVPVGTLLQYRIHFEGPGTEDIQAVEVFWLRDPDAIPPDQQGRIPEFGQSAKKIDSSTYVISIKIPLNAATGDYKMWFTAGMKNATVPYHSPHDFSVPVIYVVNHKPIKKPSVKVEQIPVQP